MTTEQLSDDTLDGMRAAALYEHAVDYTVDNGDSSQYVQDLCERISDLRGFTTADGLHADVIHDAQVLVAGRYRTWAGK